MTRGGQGGNLTRSPHPVTEGNKVSDHRIQRLRSWALAAFLAPLCLLAMTSPVKAAIHEEQFCWGKTVTPSSPCLGLNDGSVHKWVTGIYVSGVQHSVCVNHFLNSHDSRCTGGPGQGVFLDLTPSGYSDYGRIYSNSGVQGNTTVYGIIYWSDAPYPPPPPPSWHCCDNLGGNVVGDPEISSWGTGRLDVFARGNNNELWHKYYQGSWSNWESLGGQLTSGPGAVSRDGSTVDVVARGADNSVVHWSWNGTSWSSDNLGGNITSDPDMASWGSSRLDVFARGIDNALWHRYWNGGSWSPWESLGGSLASGPSAVSWGAENRIDVVARATNGSVIHWWWTGSAWSSDNLGGNILGDPEIASWSYGRLDVFARGTNNELWHKYYDTYRGASWTAWESLGGLLFSSPSAVSWGTNRIDVIARASDNSLNHSWFGS
jgi:hypothetical protein